MRRILLCLLIVALLFSLGCVSRTYTQSIDRDGSSTVVQSTNVTGLLDLSSNIGKTEEEIRQNLSLQIDQVCEASNEAGIPCTKTDDLSVDRTRSFLPGSFYTFKRTSAFPFTTYEVHVRSIPESSFGFQEDRLKDDIPLSNKRVTKSIMTRSGTGYELFYAVVLPGSIIHATAKNYSGVIEGNTATFSINEVAKDSEALVIVSQELDIPAILLFIIICVFFTSTYYFIGKYGLRKLPFMPHMKKDESAYEEPKPVKGRRRFT